MAHTVIITEEGLNRFGGILEMVVGNSMENVVGDMGANIMVNFVENAIIPVNGREGALEVIPVIPRYQGISASVWCR